MKIFASLLKFILFPFFLLPGLSLFLWSYITVWKFEDWYPKQFSGKGFYYFFSSGDYKILIYTCIFSCIVAVVSIVLAILASSGLMRMNTRLATKFEGFLYLPLLFPVVGICMGMHRLFLSASASSIINIFIMHVYFSIPYAFMVIYSGYKEIGRKWFLISKNLGLTNVQTLIHIELSMIKEYLYSAFLFAFSVSYGQYYINVFLGEYEDINFSMVIAPYLQTSNRNIGAVYILMYLLMGYVVTSFVRKGLKKWKV
ncbi:MAG: Binding-protein-dependent transport system inner rane component precursor [Bacillales bacterium]|jgi:ABC-type spermidine/putrescine transport system permease subunit II|nr:Binding-protein-dependent transport system inner rane component precursor [Bacillales bacterium]